MKDSLVIMIIRMLIHKLTQLVPLMTPFLSAQSVQSIMVGPIMFIVPWFSASPSVVYVAVPPIEFSQVFILFGWMYVTDTLKSLSK